MSSPVVLSVNKSDVHNVSKQPHPFIELIEGLGIEGDAHKGKTVQHGYLVRRDPERKNLRQVHLIALEMIEEIKQKGFQIGAGSLGENITTQHIDLIHLPEGTILKIGEEAEIQLTGLRMPCSQLNKVQDGLMKAVLQFDENKKPIPTCGVMSVILKGGKIYPNDSIQIVLPSGDHQPMKEV